MPSDPEAVYLDASALLAYVKDEEGRADVVESVLLAGEDGKLRLRTSTLSVVEVAYGVWDVAAPAPTPESEAAIDRLPPAVDLVRTDRPSGRRAVPLADPPLPLA